MKMSKPTLAHRYDDTLCGFNGSLLIVVKGATFFTFRYEAFDLKIYLYPVYRFPGASETSINSIGCVNSLRIIIMKCLWNDCSVAFENNPILKTIHFIYHSTD